jgi:hypothetical protein
MSQILSGLRLGPGFTILYGTSDPNSAAALADVKAAAIDWCYFRLGSASASTWLYRCSTGAVFQNGTLFSAATWVAK